MIISVIGSASKCIGYGKEIDSSDYVVRIWDCFWHNEKDHGAKYDIGVMRDRKGRKPLIDKAQKNKTFRVPNQEWWLYGPIKKNIFGIKIANGKYSYYGLPVIPINLEGLEKKTKLTTGTAAIIGAINLNPTKLMLYGFDSVFAGKFSSYHKGLVPKETAKIKRDLGKRKPKSHDYVNDLNLIKDAGKNIEIYHYGKRI